jgi:hypothetical protein
MSVVEDELIEVFVRRYNQLAKIATAKGTAVQQQGRERPSALTADKCRWSGSLARLVWSTGERDRVEFLLGNNSEPCPVLKPLVCTFLQS